MNKVETRSVGGNNGGAHQYLTFILAGEEYGVNILQVQEIRVWSKVRPIPKAPSWLKGIINLRGGIVPIVDLRERFNLAPLEYGPTTAVIVVRFHGETNTDQRDIGIVVDAVSEVYSIAPQAVKSAPDVCGTVEDQFIQGIAMIKDKIIVLLDMEPLLQGTLTPVIDDLKTNLQEEL